MGARISGIFSVILYHFLLVKLVTSSIRVKEISDIQLSRAFIQKYFFLMNSKGQHGYLM